MSNNLRISYVVEGATDFIVLDALVDKFLGAKDYTPTRIQPPISAIANHSGPLGGGWHGVLRWCENEGSAAGGLNNSLTLANCDCLIIHIDADIALETEIAELSLAAPCPPASAVCDKIRAHLQSLLGGSLPPKIVICVPAQCTEAWIVAALHPHEAIKFAPIECRSEPERLLMQKRDKLVRGKGKGTDKDASQYRATADKIAAQWPDGV